ncbi:hypothetical protein [Microbacterium sp. CFBP9034]|uniref:hypothetical protein n=1 Tax=Microbacterium sp. CFBP9034 TaxID=3096540 RepID=UPI002A69BC92|nr:hypothetical protein [Microbacterium sp. CFBP9034]MDY0909977.1 hypothetical protein [Microbacterium sp. CFBP9034]
MELLERVREIGADAASLGDDGVNAARQALLREIAREERVTPAREARVRRWIGGSALVGGIAAAALVVGVVVVPTAAPTASAAQLVMEKSADATIEASEEVVPRGGYTRIDTAFSWATTYDEQMPDGAGFNNAMRAEAEALLIVEDRMSTYVPADPDDEWVRERVPYRVVEALGPRASEARTAWETGMNPGAGLAGVTRYPGGVAEGGRDGDTVTYYLDSRELYADLPSDAESVVAWFEERYGAEGQPDGMGHFFVETLGDLNSFNLAPAEARAGMLRAFALLDGVEVVAVDGDRTTLAYTRDFEAGPSRVEFVLDTARGYIPESTHWGMGEYGAAVGIEGAPDWQSRTVSVVSVVDSAP